MILVWTVMYVLDWCHVCAGLGMTTAMTLGSSTSTVGLQWHGILLLVNVGILSESACSRG
jgi:hypothetical protein